MKLGSMRDWSGPILGAALLLGAAGGLAYKIISGYRHPSPDAFFSVQDQNRAPAASAADHPIQAATVPVNTPAPLIGADPAQTTPMPAAAPPNAATPPAAPENPARTASSAAEASDLPEEAKDGAECAAIKTEQSEIQGALNKKYSPEEGRYLQRRLRELAQLQVKCGE